MAVIQVAATAISISNMYTQFFQLKQAPFSIAPDPRYLFMSERHREALAHLLYGIDSGGGFVLLTGEIGAGKTTVCRCLLEQTPENCHVAYIFNPKQSVAELLQSICEEFHVPALAADIATPSVKTYVDALNSYLLQSHAAGKNNILIIDEAQSLTPEVLEQLRLLTNLETNERKLLQVILIGQPELRSILAQPELEQLAQRVIARYHLDALSPQETGAYIYYRLSIAGAAALQPFPMRLIPKIHRLTQGIPRRINLLCDRALLGAYSASSREVTPVMIEQAAREVFGDTSRTKVMLRQRWQHTSAAILGAALLTAGLAWAWQSSRTPDAAVHAALAQLPPYKLSHSLSLPPAASRPNGSAMTAMQTSVQTLAKSELAPLLNNNTMNESAALQLLGQLWGIALTQENICDEVASRHIYCYRSNGSLSELRRLNRPAILTLRDYKKNLHHVLLIGLDNTQATLRLTNSEPDFHIDVNELQKHYKGEFVTFWRPPPGYRGKIQSGQAGETVDWLNSKLAQLQDDTATTLGRTFDASMKQSLQRFQKQYGLRPDGVAGARTLMLLNNAINIPEPRLVPMQAKLFTALARE